MGQVLIADKCQGAEFDSGIVSGGREHGIGSLHDRRRTHQRCIVTLHEQRHFSHVQGRDLLWRKRLGARFWCECGDLCKQLVVGCEVGIFEYFLVFIWLLKKNGRFCAKDMNY